MSRHGPTSPNAADPEGEGARAAIEDRFGFLFARMHIRCAANSVEELRAAGLGLSGRHVAALAILEAAGPMSQHELGSTLAKDRTTMVAIVDELERAGLVDRQRNPEDRRAYALRVTDAGSEWLLRAREVLHPAEDRLLAALDCDEREALREMLQRVVYETPQGEESKSCRG